MSIFNMFIKIVINVGERLVCSKVKKQSETFESLLSLKEELEQIRERYKAHPYKEEGLSKPSWMEGDELSVLYDECDILFEKGEIYYGYIVQANEILFNGTSKMDCPANIVYSKEPIVNENPAILQDLARRLFMYKEMPLESVPEELREVVDAIKGELSRQSFDVHMRIDDEHDTTITFMSIMVFRKYLPSNKLLGSLLPIMVYPDKCKSVMIVPKKYWTESFINAYWY